MLRFEGVINGEQSGLPRKGKQNSNQGQFTIPYQVSGLHAINDFANFERIASPLKGVSPVEVPDVK